MAISRKLVKEPPVKPSVVEELIMKGGTSGRSAADKEEADEAKLIRLQLRIPDATRQQIDKIRKKRPGKLSRHTWIMEAIEEKLARESEKY